MTSQRKPAPRALPALLLAGLLTTLAGCGVAQSAPPSATNNAAGMPTRGEGMHGMHGRHDPARMQAWMAQRMAELKTKLQITPAQEAAWTTFTTATQPSQGSAYPGMRANHEELSKLPTPERLDRMRAMHTQHMNEMNTRMTQRADATKALYNVLSAEQKKTFDDEFTRAMSGRRGMHMMRGAEGSTERGDGHRMGRHDEHRS